MVITEETKLLVYQKLKTNLMACSPPMVANENVEKLTFELMGNKPVPYGYDKKIVPGMYFGSLAIRKDSVVLYFFPCYMNDEFKAVAPSLYKLLKGKTCFHFKNEEQVNEGELKLLLEKGVANWFASGYMNE